MLQSIRERAQGWIAWVIVILISIPFALWGVQEYLGVGGEPVAAKVNGQEITERELDRQFQRFRMEMRERLGKSYNPDLFDDNAMRKEVLNDLIRNNLILQASLDLGLRAGDQQVRDTILSIPAFQKNGRFDKTAYENALRNQGKSPAQFEQSVRGSLMTSQLSTVVSASEFLTAAELEEAVSLLRQKRRFDYFILPSKRFESKAPVADADVQAYYQEHQAEFRTPERIKLDYILLSANALASDGSSVDEKQLQELYESRLDQYRTPEQRRVRHILITLPMGADENAGLEARARIDKLHGSLKLGADFAELAKESSQDPGSAGQGGDLGMFEKGLMDQAFDEAAFALELGAISEPVRSSFGYHLIQVTEIQAEQVVPFEEVREELVILAGSDEAERRYFELAEQLGIISYENPDSLLPAADALELEIQHTDWVDRSGGSDGISGEQKVIGAAFSDEVLRQGFNSELIEIDDPKLGQQAIVVRVAEHEESALRSVDEVREEISRQIRSRNAAEAARNEARALAERIASGESVENVAADYSLEHSALVERNDPETPAGVLTRAFLLPAPVNATPSVGVADLWDGSAVVVLRAIEKGSLDALEDHERDSERTSISRSKSRNYYDRLVDSLQRRADIWVAEQDAPE